MLTVMTLSRPSAAPRPAPANSDAETAPAIEHLYRTHVTTVYRIIGRVLGPGASHEDIEDLTQLTFLAAHRALPSFRGECQPSTWLCGIAVRTALQWQRGHGRRRRLLEAMARERPAHTPRADLPEGAAASRAALAHVWRTLLEMKEGKRAVYVLHEIEGMPGAEIARALEIPEGTVWTRLHHARKEILAALEKAGIRP